MWGVDKVEIIENKMEEEGERGGKTERPRSLA